MLDRLLPGYLKETITVDGQSLNLSTLVSGRIFRVRAAQAHAFPYIVVSGGSEIDLGQTCGPRLTEELGSYLVIIAGDPKLGLEAVDPIADMVVKYLEACRQRYIPTPSSNPKLWVQCILMEDREAFVGRTFDGGEQPMIGYYIPVRSGYGANLVTS